MRQPLRAALALGVLVGLVVALLRSIARDPRRSPAPLAPPPAPLPAATPPIRPSVPVDVAIPPETVPPETVPPEAVAAGSGEVPTWAAPIEGGCPEGYPIKAKETSGIYHRPGGLSYERTRPDRCYVDEAAAEGDGFRAAKR